MPPKVVAQFESVGYAKHNRIHVFKDHRPAVARHIIYLFANQLAPHKQRVYSVKITPYTQCHIGKGITILSDFLRNHRPIKNAKAVLIR